MILTVAFNHTAKDYYGSLCTKDGKPQIFLRVPKGKKQIAVEYAGQTPEEKLLARQYRAFFKPYAIESQADFENHFIQCVKEYILDTATQSREILQVENFQLTPDLIIGLAKRLKRKSAPKLRRRNLDQLLVLLWKTNIGTKDKPRFLNRLGKQELCDYINAFFKTPFKAAAVWQAAYRDLGLFYAGDPGPKPKS